MKKITLEEALKYIKIKYTQISTNDDGPKGLCFIVGAGISCPIIPPADAILDKCREKIEVDREKMNLPKPKEDILDKTYKDQMTKYFDYFYEAYQNSYEQQKFFEELVKDKEISNSNIMLANIIRSIQIAPIVVTPNFDDFLSRAFDLFPSSYIRIDHPDSIYQIIPDRKKIQIIHVHGSYKFFDICNTKGKVLKRGKKIAQQLANIFLNMIIIVIGYSGRGNDGIMQGIKKIFKSNYRFNIYWFCYKESDVDNLPGWLKNEEAVFCVVPDRKFKFDPESGEYPFIPQDKDNDKYANNLSAEKVFEGLIETFNVEYPLCFTQPLEHYEKIIERSLPLKNKESNISPYVKIINEVEKGKEFVNESNQRINCKIDKLMNLMKSSQYQKALEEIEKLIDIKLNKEQIEKLFECFSSLSVPFTFLVDNDSDESIERIFDRLLRNNELYFSRDFNKSNAMFMKGKVLGEFTLLEKEILVYLNIIKEYIDSSDMDVQKLLVDILQNLRSSIHKLNSPEDKLRLYQNIMEYYKSSRNPEFQLQIAHSLYDRGLLLKELNNLDDAINSFDRVNYLYIKFDHPDMLELLAKSLIQKGVILREQNKIRESHNIFDELISDYKNSDVPAEIRLVEEAQKEKEELAPIESTIYYYMDLIKSEKDKSKAEESGYFKALWEILEGLNQGENEKYILERFINKYRESEEPFAQECIAIGLFKKADILGTLSLKDDELRTYNEFLRRYRISEETKIKELIPQILMNKASVLEQFEMFGDALSTYNEIINRFHGSDKEEIREFLLISLENKREILRLYIDDEEELERTELLLDELLNKDILTT